MRWRIRQGAGAFVLASAPFWLVPGAPFWRLCLTGLALVLGCALIVDGAVRR